ncbi:glucose-6-phosphate isomerase [Pseudoalteromonas sp. NBT06-2]|uniref:glucose-6-phosphate isomerase n=1 Tax=Pseudoalteromonas sp. NBT06-2 TaxID=2025950 RepID=UPI000BA5EC22|nr:glucose-6-phosphate isomerase [Pseudoalteromonas sp. NBT06-2]PAJ72993.1 glucose-6-phosphate isomerase [Pseudoalteromonas sp. NBT06-2]
MTQNSKDQSIFDVLETAAIEVKKRHLMTLFSEQPNRAHTYSLNVEPFFLDYSKQAINKNAFKALINFAKYKELEAKRDAMFQGEKINHTENRAVLHTALRDSSQITNSFPQTSLEIESTKTKMLNFVDAVTSQKHLGHTGKVITDVISIGIGGSFFGPKMLQSALIKHNNNQIKIHYLANIDGEQIVHLLDSLNPETCLVIVASKSWTTAETQLNAQSVLKWFNNTLPQKEAIKKHWVALTAKSKQAEEFGIQASMIFPMWDFVGGRYSVWSTIGLPLALSIGSKAFIQILEGAASIDKHFREAPLDKNMPVIMALLGYWQQEYFNLNNLMVLPYSHNLKSLPAYLQQLDMESNGKAVNSTGDEVKNSGPILWGAEGTNCQHSFMQLFHQGKQSSMIDFILPAKGHEQYQAQHKLMIANCLAQAQALLQGKTLTQATNELLATGLNQEQANDLAKHKTMPGNTSSNMLIIEEITPHSMGALLALYEHKVFCQGIFFDVNSFDQWGVELGKSLGKNLLDCMETSQTESLDPSTSNLLDYINKKSEQTY